MNYSTRLRYALAALVLMATNPEVKISLAQIANELTISKIYLEQIFTVLKQAKIVQSSKGPKGGYLLSRNDFSVYDVFYALEPRSFNDEPRSCGDPLMNRILLTEVYEPGTLTLKNKLSQIFISDLAHQINLQKNTTMYYI